jgi:hypothetical protein
VPDERPRQIFASATRRRHPVVHAVRVLLAVALLAGAVALVVLLAA